MLQIHNNNLERFSFGKPSKKKNYGDSEIGPTPLNPPTPTSDREKKCRDSCEEI